MIARPASRHLVLALGLIAAGCGTTSSVNYVSLRGSTLLASDESADYHLERISGQNGMHAAVLVEGRRLVGARAFERGIPEQVHGLLQFAGVRVPAANTAPAEVTENEVRFRDGFHLLDHPDLATWQEQLAVLREQAAAPRADVAAVVGAMQEFPFPRAGLPVVQKIAASIEDATAVLVDPRSAALPAGMQRTLARRMLDGQPGDVLLASCVRRPELYTDGDLVRRLAGHGNAGDETDAALVAHFDDFPYGDRPAIYRSLTARQLHGGVVEPATLVSLLDDLPHGERGAAARDLLTVDGGSTAAFAEAVVRDLEDIRYDERPRVLLAASSKMARGTSTAELIGSGIAELPLAERGSTARRLLAGGDPALARTVLRRIEDVAYTDRPLVLRAAVTSLAGASDLAVLVGPALSTLPASTRGPTVRELLADPAVAAKISGEVVARIEDVSYADRAAVLRTVADGTGFTEPVQLATIQAARTTLPPSERRRILIHIALRQDLSAAAKRVLRELDEDS